MPFDQKKIIQKLSKSYGLVWISLYFFQIHMTKIILFKIHSRNSKLKKTLNINIVYAFNLFEIHN